MPPSTPPIPSEKKTNWVLIGCGGCLGLIVLIVLGFAGIFYGVSKVIKSSEPYKVAVEAVRNSPEAQEDLGTPIEPGFMIQGSVNTNTSNGTSTETADLTVPVNGPKGSGKVHYAATKAGDKWEVSDFTLTEDASGKKIDLGH